MDLYGFPVRFFAQKSFGHESTAEDGTMRKSIIVNLLLEDYL